MEVEREKKEKLAAARKKLNQYKMNKTTGKPSTESSKPADVPQIYQNLNTQATTFSIFNPAAGDNNNVTTDSQFVQPNQEPETIVAPKAAGAFSQYNPQSAFAQTPAFQQQKSVPDTHTTNLFSSPPSVVSVLTSHQEPPAVSIPSSTLFASSDHHLSETPYLFQTSSQYGVSEQQQQPNNNVVERICGITPLDANVVGPISTDQQKLSDRSDPIVEPAMIEFETPQLVPAVEFENKNYYHASAPPMENIGASAIENTEYTSTPLDVASEVEPPTAMTFESHNAAANIHIDQNEASHVFASSLFGAAGRSDLDTVFSFCGTQVPATNAEEPVTSSVTGSSNPLVSPSQEQSIFEEIQSQVSFQAKTESNDNLLEDVLPNESERFAETTDLVQDTAISTVNEPPASSVSQSADNAWDSPSKLLNDFSDSFVSEQEQLVPEAICSSNADVQEQLNDQVYDQMKSMQEALELQIEELRRENTYLLNRQTDLTFKIEDSERLAHEFKLERDRIKEESMTASQAMRARINSLCEENQRIVKNSTEVGVDLRAKLEDKTRQLEEMQKAVIIVSQSKMDFAGRLDHELERVKDLQTLVAEKDEEIQSLRNLNSELEENLKREQQKDAVVQQLQDQTRHYQVQCETLQRELNGLRRKLKSQETMTQSPSSPNVVPDEPHDHSDHHHHHGEEQDDSNEETVVTDSSNDALCENTHHHHSEECSHIDHVHKDQHLDHDEHHHHAHEHDEHHHHAHEHDEHHNHDHEHDEHHNHDHEHGEHHHHDHEHTDDSIGVVARRGPSDEITELKKTLHRLEWENSSFRNELDVLAIDAKQKKSYEERCLELQEKNEYLKKEVEQLEHVIIQLQGENDTIGDYITLYQTQKLALKECAKEKDAQLEQLALEREMLLRRLAELTALVKDLRDNKSESGSQCADDHINVNTLEAPVITGGNKKQIEGKIRDLLTEISSSTLIENFHPCAVCSGRLMTV